MVQWYCSEHGAMSKAQVFWIHSLAYNKAGKSTRHISLHLNGWQIFTLFLWRKRFSSAGYIIFTETNIPTSGSGLFINQRLSASLLPNQRCFIAVPAVFPFMFIPINIYTICPFKAQRTLTSSSSQLHTKTHHTGLQTRLNWGHLKIPEHN